MSWPETVPVLTAKDIHKGGYDGPDGNTHCLLGWVGVTFMFGQGWCEAASAISEVCEERFGESNILTANDGELPKPRLARAWNEAMRRLGYTEVIEV